MAFEAFTQVVLNGEPAPSGPTLSCQPQFQGVESFHVVTQADEFPFTGDFFFPTQAEASKSEDRFDDSEDGFYGRSSLFIDRFPFVAGQLFFHRE